MVQTKLPLVGDEGEMRILPEKVLERRMIKKNNRPVIQVLIKWMSTAPEDATWEDAHKLAQQFPEFNFD